MESANTLPTKALPSAEPLWTAEDVAAYLRVSLSMVYKLRRQGSLRSAAIGKLFRFDPEDVRAYARGEMLRPRRTPLRQM
jgi:excisionase family DNA binding protein